MSSTGGASGERFALYGFEVEIPTVWRVELNPKSTREKGDVAFHTGKGNSVFVSWGPLDLAKKRFKTLDEQRDSSLNEVKKRSSVKSVEIGEMREDVVGGHRALISHISASIKQAFLARGRENVQDVWYVHFYCPNLSRYYVVYSLLKDPEKYEDFRGVFNNLAKSFVCHTDQLGNLITL